MIVYPAIDLVAGNVVRLRQGVRSKMDVYSADPVAQAEAFAAAGATHVHMVDLSRAFGEDEAACEANLAAIAAVASSAPVKVDVGGGVRSIADVERLLDAGAAQVSIGTPLVRDPDFAAAAVREFGDRVVADVAARDGVVRVNGWRDEAPLSLDDLLSAVVAMGFARLVYTDVARDGMQAGVDPEAYRSVAAACGFPVTASGGVTSIDDVARLAALGDDVVEGVICGRALYEGTLDLGRALAVAGGE
ncbi:1-(5-phosphoribosyl)-5-[(5-phosphoribosylamino)methylideneamino] imidazole-4-carboxamide isomerase [Atopobiaceae bacterium 24-176]